MLSRRGFVVGSAAGLAALGCRARLDDSDVRAVDAVVPAMRTRDGAGVSLRRALGSRALPLLDPFLMLDEIHSDREEDWIAGFPRHPHRGFETVSYLISGGFEHRDSSGNHGLIADGGVQWMTAGRGIIHSEMPRQAAGLDLWGLQLWVNLPAARKMSRPRYQDLGAEVVPEIAVGAARARLVAGLVDGHRGPVEGIVTDPTMLDATLPAGQELRLALPATHTAFVYALAGEVEVGPARTRVPAGSIAALGRGRAFTATSASGGRFLLLAAAAIGEPVARRGTFVMNTEAELDQAVADYRSGRLVGG